MKNKDLLIAMVETLAYSWGGGPYPEVYWALNDLIKFLNAEYNIAIPPLISEEVDAIRYLLDDLERLL